MMITSLVNKVKNQDCTINYFLHNVTSDELTTFAYNYMNAI